MPYCLIFISSLSSVLCTVMSLFSSEASVEVAMTFPSLSVAQAIKRPHQALFLVRPSFKVHSFHSLNNPCFCPCASSTRHSGRPSSKPEMDKLESADIGTVSRSQSRPIILPSLVRSCVSKSMVYAWALLRAAIIVPSNSPVPWLEFAEISLPAFLLPEMHDS